MITIDLRDWDIAYTDLVEWVTENSINLYTSSGGNGMKVYIFPNDEDFVAFKLKFSKGKSSYIMGYTGISDSDVGLYNCPYIPYEK